MRFFPLILRIILGVFFIFAVEYYHQLVLFPYWKPVSIIVLVGFILYPILFFRWYKNRKNCYDAHDGNVKYYDHVFYRKWIAKFIVQVLVGLFAIAVSFYGFKKAVEQGFLVDLWWPVVLGLIVLNVVFGSLLIYFLMLRKMEVGISHYGVFVVGQLIPWQKIQKVVLDKNNRRILLSVVFSEEKDFVIPTEIEIKASSISGSLEKLFKILQSCRRDMIKNR